VSRIAGTEKTLGAAEQAGAVLVPTNSSAGPKRLADLGLIFEHGSQDFSLEPIAHIPLFLTAFGKT
jgi:hypothetical protein